MKASEIRQTFFDFFIERGHTLVPSSPVVPADDPSLLFANAGMNQFKGVFLEQETRSYSRAISTQKCIRVSGKHNDLEEVGHDGYHHTFFEMLGNWSFGDYYKEEAIEWAWDLLTRVYGIDGKRLTPTVHVTDDEADGIWRKVVPGVEVLRFDKDNFWEMGETGPCGPCSEIHVDLGPEGCDRRGEKGHRCEINGTCGRYVELWNNVFIQYNQDGSGKKTELPAKHVDTGMGLERLVAVLQGKFSNYDTDLFEYLLQRVGDLTGVPYDPGPDGMAHRVIGDHVRALTFAIADGASPSNEGRGYVVRRILRRASRFARKLGVHEPLLYKLVPQVVEDLGPVFPEVRGQVGQVEMWIQAEEEGFGETLDQGLKIFEEIVTRLESGGAKEIPGRDAFTLYDTFGFPLDLTELMGRERGLSVDVEGFEKEMAGQKKRSRQAAGVEGEKVPGTEAIQGIGGSGGSCFLGYDTTRAGAKVLGTAETEHQGEAAVALVLDETPFYAESGGQIGDTGVIRGDGFEFRVLDTQKVEDRIVHIGRFDSGVAKEGMEAEAVVDAERRQRTARNHSATHLMHWALRGVLGTHVRQQGSFVGPDHLRFDFSHPKKLSLEEIFEIERLVNQKIRANAERETREMEYQEAIQKGVLAFFGDKYGDRVRVVTFGDFSRELCGGTHVDRTGDIGIFLISGESSIASGVRRIEGITGREAVEKIIANRQVLGEVGRLLKASPDQLPGRVEGLQAEVKELKKRPRVSGFDAGKEAKRLRDGAEAVGGIRIISGDLGEVPVDAVRRVADSLRSGSEPTVGVLAGASEGKVHLLVFLSDALVKEKGLHAGKIIKDVAAVVGGGGGGRPEFAQAGGRDASKIPDALEKATDLIRQRLGGGGV